MCGYQRITRLWKTTVVNSLVKERVQHLGLDQKLVRKTEQIAFLNGFEEIALQVE